MLGTLLANAAWFAQNWGWVLSAVIVVFGLLIVGGSDAKRFSFTRLWAISGVCFDESIRKRVLWIAPLAIFGVIGITQFQRALDEQDALRQSVKICLFATGLVVMLSSIILACTNLPKEIESRVIHTIVTKPITRLELVLGKVIGFARVSLAIIGIMGIFTWVYMRVGAAQKGQQITYRLNEGDVGDTERARLSEYKQTGLLTARTFWAADELDVFGQPPQPDTAARVITNEGDQDFLAGFPINREVMFGPPQEEPQDWARQGLGQNGLVIRVLLSTQRTGAAEDQPQTSGPMGPTFGKAAPAKLAPPLVSFQLLNDQFNDMVAGSNMVGGSTAQQLMQNIAAYSKTMKIEPEASGTAVRLGEPVRLPDGNTGQYAYAWAPPQHAINLFNYSRFFVRISGISGKVDYIVGPKPVSCFVPQFKPGSVDVDAGGATVIEPFGGRDGNPELLAFRGRMGLHLDQEMSGGKDAPGATACYSFRNAPAATLVQDRVPFQLNVEVDRSNSEVESGHEDATKMTVQVIDLATRKLTRIDRPVLVESRLPAFFSIPADSITSGDYDITLHCENSSQTIGLMPGSLLLVTSEQWFELNLIKSLSIIWMMSILVIILAVLCSTFLSWPIAIVLTLLLLLGHWGIDQLADTAGPGLGRQIVNDFKFTDVPIARIVSTGVDSLARGLNLLANVLPDTSRFDAIEDIEQGVSISGDRLMGALTVLGGFGAPAIVLAYLILRNKEVAP
jgi:ABC-type transport system involved in multi-copper enzyme maturation permease subunit